MMKLKEGKADTVLQIRMASRYKISDIKKEVEESGWTLVSTTYSNLKTEMEFLCPEGHQILQSLEKWRRKKKCPICENNPLKHTSAILVKKKGFRILALDQASITSGWSLFEDGNLIQYGNWTSNGKHHTERVSLTKCWVASLIETTCPDFICLEDIQLQRNFKGEEAVVTYKKLAALQGVLSNYIYEKKIPFEVIPSSTWRAAAEIKGKTRSDKKRNAQLKIKKLYDISVTQDEADAILIGECIAKKLAQNVMMSFV